VVKIAFAGIGNPEKFFSTLLDNKINPSARLAFPDHHNYDIHDILYLAKQGEEKTTFLITTRKDFVKIQHLFLVENNRPLSKLDIAFIAVVDISIFSMEAEEYLKNTLLDLIICT
jgi:tetraacyldisaccharide-1-P 4'-kinase